MDNLREGRYAALGNYILLQDFNDARVVTLDRVEVQPGDAAGVLLTVAGVFWDWDEGMAAMRKAHDQEYIDQRALYVHERAYDAPEDRPH